jgi:hypothetical protein
MVVAMTCPVESAVPSREARIQQGEDEHNAAACIPHGLSGEMLVFRQPPREISRNFHTRGMGFLQT